MSATEAAKKKRGRPKQEKALGNEVAKEGKEAKKQKGKRKKKSDGKPKRGLSAYMFFVKKNRSRLKEENPTLSFGDLGRAVGIAWKALSKEEKVEYEQLATADKARYQAEKEQEKEKTAAVPEAEADDDEEEEDGGKKKKKKTTKKANKKQKKNPG